MPDAEVFLYLTTRGRRTGLPREIEIWFVEDAGRYYMVSELGERAGWVRNLRSEPRVGFRVGSRGERPGARATTPALARLLTPAHEPQRVAHVRELMDAKYGWSDGLVIELDPEGPARHLPAARPSARAEQPPGSQLDRFAIKRSISSRTSS